MRTHFDPAVRLLACDRCGAPLSEASGAIDQTCDYCSGDEVSAGMRALVVRTEEGVRWLS